MCICVLEHNAINAAEVPAGRAYHGAHTWQCKCVL